MITGPARRGAAPARPAALRLRPLRRTDERAFAEGHRVMAAEDFTFGLGYQPGMRWPDYLQLVADREAGRNLPPRYVPSAFLVANVAGQIVGRTSIRYELNDFLAREGGHIGYAVLPSFRRRGYATEILRQSLLVARAHGIGRVLVTCHDDNSGSAVVIEACGGELDSVISIEPDARLMRRYWIG